MHDNIAHPYGSARWADTSDLNRAKLLKRRSSGPHLGYWGKRKLALSSDAPGIIIGGAGSGKLATLLAHTALTCRERCVFADPKGEIAAISILAQTLMGKAAYVINPHRLHDHVLPAHTVELLSFLDPAAVSFTSDVKLVCMELIAATGGAEAKFFEERARAWLEIFVKFDAIRYGKANLPRIARHVATLTGGDNDWQNLAAEIEVTAPALTATVNEIDAFKLKGNRAFEGIVAEINNGLAFLSDPALQAVMAEGTPDFSFDALCDPKQAANLYIVIPAESLATWRPFVRLIFGALTIVKTRHPQSPRINFLIDEAGQLGAAEFLKRSYTLSRGAGIRTTAVFQDIGQIGANFGREALATFLGSAQTRQFIGTRDFDTARLVSDMIGQETLAWINPVAESQAQLARRKALVSILSGEDAALAFQEARHHQMASEAPEKVARPLLNPSEVLALPEDKQVLFVSGAACPPVLADRKPYYRQPEYNGMHLPNPFIGSKDRITLPGHWFPQRVVTGKVPRKYRHLPQNRDGSWRYVQSYRPR